MLACARPAQPAVIRVDLAAIFVSLELSCSKWLITSLSPGSGKMSKHVIPAGNVGELLTCFAELKRKAAARTGVTYPIVSVYEAGLDGFWLHRVLVAEGIENHVVDPASITTSRRRRKAKTDRIDGEKLIRTLLAHKRGEPHQLIRIADLSRHRPGSAKVLPASEKAASRSPLFATSSVPTARNNWPSASRTTPSVCSVTSSDW